MARFSRKSVFFWARNKGDGNDGNENARALIRETIVYSLLVIARVFVAIVAIALPQGQKNSLFFAKSCHHCHRITVQGLGAFIPALGALPSLPSLYMAAFFGMPSGV